MVLELRWLEQECEAGGESASTFHRHCVEGRGDVTVGLHLRTHASSGGLLWDDSDERRTFGAGSELGELSRSPSGSMWFSDIKLWGRCLPILLRASESI